MKTKRIIFAASLILLLGLLQVKGQQIGSGCAIGANNFNIPLLSGLYQTDYQQAGFPGNETHAWNHLFVLRHANPNNNHQFQMASNYNENDRVFFRKIASMDLLEKNPPWHELATRGNNNFIGNQVIEGDLQIGAHRGLDNVPTGYANKIDFGLFENYDNIWIARYNKSRDCSELRINIGDDCGESDRFSVGATYWENSLFTERFTVVANGNVGIGQSNPTHKLEVAGTIRAQEVKIENANWPDYVFSKDYQLPSLSEVSKHIEENKHLPGIPSAKEVEENGINLSEMNAKLLQKIEEMTLYMIQQQQAIEELQKEVKDLRNKD